METKKPYPHLNLNNISEDTFNMMREHKKIGILYRGGKSQINILFKKIKELFKENDLEKNLTIFDIIHSPLDIESFIDLNNNTENYILIVDYIDKMNFDKLDIEEYRKIAGNFYKIDVKRCFGYTLPQ